MPVRHDLLRTGRLATGPDNDDPWGGLMAAAQRGDGGAYAHLLFETERWLKRYFSKRLPPDIVEDATQETLLAIHSRRHTYEPGRPFKAWLAGIARYKWIDRLRLLKRDPAAPGVEEMADTASADDHGAAVTSAILLRELLAQIKPAQAQVIRLVKLEGLSIEEASDRTGQSNSLVKVNIHRGLAKLSALTAAG